MDPLKNKRVLFAAAAAMGLPASPSDSPMDLLNRVMGIRADSASAAAPDSAPPANDKKTFVSSEREKLSAAGMSPMSVEEEVERRWKVIVNSVATSQDMTPIPNDLVEEMREQLSTNYVLVLVDTECSYYRSKLPDERGNDQVRPTMAHDKKPAAVDTRELGDKEASISVESSPMNDDIFRNRLMTCLRISPMHLSYPQSCRLADLILKDNSLPDASFKKQLSDMWMSFEGLATCHGMTIEAGGSSSTHSLKRAREDEKDSAN